MDGATNCTAQMDDTLKKMMPYFVSIFTALPLWLAIVLNTTIVFFYLTNFKSRMKGWSDWLMLNIATADLLMVMFSVPSIWIYTTKYWCFNAVNAEYGFSIGERNWLNVVDTIRNCCGCVSNYSMVLLSIDRFKYTVRRIIHREIEPYRKIFLKLIILYVFCALYIGSHYVLIKPQYDIYHEWFAAVVSAIIPLFVMYVMYGNMAWKLWSRRNILNGQTTPNAVRRRRKAAIFLLLFLLIISLCILPSMVQALLDTSVETELFNLMTKNIYAPLNFIIYLLNDVVSRTCNAMLLFFLSSALKRYLQDIYILRFTFDYFTK